MVAQKWESPQRSSLKSATIIPEVTDPSWVQIASPVLPWLAEQDRDWKALRGWAKKHKMTLDFFRNVLAWLEEAGCAESYLRTTRTPRGKLSETILWKATDDWRERLDGVTS